MLIELVLVASAFLSLVYYYFTAKYDYWKVRGVKYAEPSFIFGNYFDMVFMRRPRPEVHQGIYNAGAGEPYIGIVGIREPALYIRDPEIIRHVLAKDFPHFHDRVLAINEKKNPLSAHLFSLEGARWRALRTKLTPTFTSGKMKNMLPLMQECADEMIALLEPHAQRKEVIEMRDILARFATDVIGTCAFGVECNSLKNPEAEFRKMGAKMFVPSRFRILMQNLFQTFPSLMNIIPVPKEQKIVGKFFRNAIDETLKYREENGVDRRDFLDLLIQIKKKGTIVGNAEELKNDAFVKSMANMKIEEFEFTDNLLAAQAFVFFLAGFETSSTTMSYALIELSRNKKIQDRLRQEIDEIYERHGNKFDYDALMKMPYLDKVISETLRMYPPLPALNRMTTEPYKMPDSDLLLEKGIKVFIPIHAIHHDPAIYPNPETFDPERFSEEAKRTRHNYVYLPFGEGPRNCIGSRFGLLQTKISLAALLLNFEFELGPDMPYPPVISSASFLLTTEHGTHLRITKRHPKTPIIYYSSLSTRTADYTRNALHLFPDYLRIEVKDSPRVRFGTGLL